MSLNAYNLSAGLFSRGLTNVQGLLSKAETHAAANGSGEAGLLNAQLAVESQLRGAAADGSYDVHKYTLTQQVHWATEGAKLAIGHLLGTPGAPAASDDKSFADLRRRLDATLAHLRAVPPNDLEAGLERTIVIAHPRGSMRFHGEQFLREFAIPHFYYHVTSAYSILRNQGVHLTMGDFLGSWEQG